MPEVVEKLEVDGKNVKLLTVKKPDILLGFGNFLIGVKKMQCSLLVKRIWILIVGTI